MPPALADRNVDILSYSQSKGLFAGASLGSASMGTDNDANKELYGKSLDATQIIRDGAVPVPPPANRWLICWRSFLLNGCSGASSEIHGGELELLPVPTRA
jgi:lipid-binding SYLF domain-containing protein